jgi:hypothetical protein
MPEIRQLPTRCRQRLFYSEKIHSRSEKFRSGFNART